jgi:acyl dehydratase
MTTGNHSGLYYEDFPIGSPYKTTEHLVTRAEIVNFADLTGDQNPLHVDPALANAAGFRDVLAHGALLQALALGLIAETGVMEGTTIALIATRARFVKAVYAGDRIHANFYFSRKRPTRTRDRGIVWRKVTMINQVNEVVAIFDLTALVRRRPEFVSADRIGRA